MRRPPGFLRPSRPPSRDVVAGSLQDSGGSWTGRWFTAGLGGRLDWSLVRCRTRGTAGLAGSSSVRGARGNDPRFANSHVASARRVWRFGAGGVVGSGGHPCLLLPCPHFRAHPPLPPARLAGCSVHCLKRCLFHFLL